MANAVFIIAAPFATGLTTDPSLARDAYRQIRIAAVAGAP
jgi:hypothetical protein